MVKSTKKAADVKNFLDFIVSDKSAEAYKGSGFEVIK